MSNMTVEDILNELGGYGSVSLRWVKFQMSASTSRPVKECWRIEVTLPGYSNAQATQSYVSATGPTIREVVEKAYELLEAYVFSVEAQDDRKRYEEQHAFYQNRYDEASAWERGGHNAIRPPERFKPPIIWGQPRTWEHRAQMPGSDLNPKAL